MIREIHRFRRLLFGDYDSVTRTSRYFNKPRKHPYNRNVRVAPLKMGTLDDIRTFPEHAAYARGIGEHASYYYGLEQYVRLTQKDGWRRFPAYVFDNHNLALFAWIEALREKKIKAGATLFHIDSHDDADMDDGTPIPDVHTISLEEARKYATRTSIAKFIYPAVQAGLISKFYFVKPNFTSEEKFVPASVSQRKTPEGDIVLRHCPHTQIGVYSSPFQRLINGDFDPRSVIVDFDVDYFDSRRESVYDQELSADYLIGNRNDHIDRIRAAIQQSGVTTIATSPSYIGQEVAVNIIKRVLG